MKRLVILLGIAAILSSCLALVAIAGPNANTKIVLSARAHDTKGRCVSPAPTPCICGQLVTTGQVGGTYDILVMAADFTELAGEQFGIAYDPQISIWSWTTCAAGALTIPSAGWPGSGTGIAIAHNCVRAGSCMLELGFLYMTAYGPGHLCVVPDPRTGKVEVGDCIDPPATSSVIDVISDKTPSHLGCVGFGFPGYDGACGQATATSPSTWGNIKALYK